MHMKKNLDLSQVRIVICNLFAKPKYFHQDNINARVVILMPLDWSPPSLWTDASGFSVDASGLVPPPHPPRQVRPGGGRGGQTATY